MVTKIWMCVCLLDPLDPPPSRLLSSFTGFVLQQPPWLASGQARVHLQGLALLKEELLAQQQTEGKEARLGLVLLEQQRQRSGSSRMTTFQQKLALKGSEESIACFAGVLKAVKEKGGWNSASALVRVQPGFLPCTRPHR